MGKEVHLSSGVQSERWYWRNCGFGSKIVDNRGEIWHDPSRRPCSLFDPSTSQGPPFALLSCPIHDHAELLMPLPDSLVVPAASFLLPAVIDFEERGRSPCE